MKIFFFLDIVHALTINFKNYHIFIVRKILHNTHLFYLIIDILKASFVHEITFLSKYILKYFSLFALPFKIS
jgi:hypothetical protein